MSSTCEVLSDIWRISTHAVWWPYRCTYVRIHNKIVPLYTLVWGSLRLAPMMVSRIHTHSHMAPGCTPGCMPYCHSDTIPGILVRMSEDGELCWVPPPHPLHHRWVELGSPGVAHLWRLGKRGQSSCLIP